MPAPITIGEASAEISRLVELANLAAGFATMMPTAQGRERMLRREAEFMGQALELAGPVSADILAMSDDDLLRELQQ